MKKLVLEMNDDLETRADGVLMDPIEAGALKVALKYSFLLSEEIHHDNGEVRLVFDLERSQDTPNFATMDRPV